MRVPSIEVLARYSYYVYDTLKSKIVISVGIRLYSSYYNYSLSLFL